MAWQLLGVLSEVTFVSNRLINILALLSLACGMAAVPSHTARAATGIESLAAGGAGRTGVAGTCSRA